MTSTTPEGDAHSNPGPEPIETNVAPQVPPADPQPIEPEDPSVAPRTNTGPNE